MNAEKGHSQSADNSQLLAHKSSPQGGHAFKLKAPYKPTGDQPQAIEKLVEGFKEGNQFETLLGVTGSGKTFTMANVIAQLNKPTLVLAHNKTLAAQLYGEMKECSPITQWNILSPSMRKSQNRWYFVVCGWLNIQMLWKR